ncbi:PhoX family protein [Roseateles chitosanitabidus]|uniref:PhoX family protein n=1 Tax=Roseateles chitosanitabidus TaxID=65048 RepID=UPI00082D442C|nr:PhoX family phosphatase [Roseateles chitosanitabidus]MBO9688895.1 PhoX family phosphatase [Roseateles chitosanitabidus]
MSKQHDIVASQVNEYDEDVVVNPSSNPHFDDILAARLSRRVALKGGISTTAAALLGGSILSACGGSDDPAPTPAPAPPPAPAALKIGFNAVAKNKNDLVTVPDGYNVSILHAVGDPMHFGDLSWQDDGSESADSYNRRIGDGHDGMYWFGLSDAGAYQADRSDRGLLAVNHEYVVAPYVLHPAGRAAGATRNATEVEKEIYAHGVSIVEVKRDGGNTTMVRGSRYNRRVTSATTMDFTGPARGNAQLATLFSTGATQTRGTNNNCANGYTPWGTYLTCEENYLNVISRAAGDDAQRSAKEIASLNRYGLPQNRKSPYLWETAGSTDLYARWNSSVTGAAATADYRNTINTFGWVVEIDPFAPDSTPAKRTALGRFNHEGAWPAPAVAGKPIVIYMGDDSRNEYIYKFVSKANWDAADVGKGMAAGAKYLDEGTLYVARFNADGSGDWLELSYGKNGLDATNAAYAFADQGDVLINARLAADKLGATKMDRPEWGAVHPTNAEVYMTLTNNSNRVANTATPTGSQLKPDAANPRYYEDIKGGTTSQKGNPNGHIIRWRESATDVTKLNWDIYLFGAESTAAADVNLSSLTDVNDFSSPDGLFFDKRGMLWIQTDDGAYTDVTNCMMLAAIPGKVGDGGKANAAGGTSTIAGAKATADTVRRFLVGPKECEITGIAMTPDNKTLFFNVQHPGEDSTPDFAAKTFGSYWPASQSDATAKKRPRSATVVITRKDNGDIGV